MYIKSVEIFASKELAEICKTVCFQEID